ncbi:hypothetical protein JQ604_13620 [Bradyrhizobium jicamae]|nr:hypothetical protein [Bradyrhizobium jicamae]
MDHVSRSGPGLYHAHAFPEEAIMRDIIESLSPEDGQIDWKWVGSVFAFYVVVVVAGAGVVITH